MKKRINNIVSIIVITGLFFFLIINQKRNNKIESEILFKGYYSFAIISDLVASSGSTRSVYYTYNSDYKNGHDYVSKEFYNKKNIGDTIIIKVLINDLSKSLIIEDIDYKACMFKNASKIVKYLPKCK